MCQLRRHGVIVAVLSVSVCALSAREPGRGSESCKAVHADLVEDRSTTECKPGHTSCFLGEVDGNHGLRGATYFKGDSGAAGPGTSPGFISYSGVFEYVTDRGTLVARETGVVNQTTGNPESGAVTAYQKIIEATGEFSGITGYFFVSGFGTNGHIVTKLTGELCLP
jgi:hypothetical protein